MRAERAVHWVSRDYEKAVRRMNRIKNEMDIHYSYKSGQTEKALEIARKMKEMGDSVERIQTITGLSLETIEQMDKKPTEEAYPSVP